MAREKKDGKFLNCYIQKDIIEKLNVYSKETGISKTFIVEKALKEYLDNSMRKRINV